MAGTGVLGRDCPIIGMTVLEHPDPRRRSRTAGAEPDTQS